MYPKDVMDLEKSKHICWWQRQLSKILSLNPLVQRDKHVGDTRTVAPSDAMASGAR